MSVFFIAVFGTAVIAAIYSLYVSLADYIPQALELLFSNVEMANSSDSSYAVWPTRLRLSEAAITGVPQIFLRRRPKPFARKMSWRPAAKGLPRVTRQLRYAVAPERVIVLS